MAADKSREGVTGYKIRQLGRLLRPKHTRTLVRAKTVRHIRLGEIERNKGVRIAGLVFDVDETMASHHGKIPEAVFAHLELQRRWQRRTLLFP